MRLVPTGLFVNEARLGYRQWQAWLKPVLEEEAPTKETVLVIEDDGNLLRALQYSLQREGYAVRTATEGESGLEAAREARPSLVILDVMLPRLDGFEVCRILRRDSDVPVLMLTARGEEIDRVLGLELGADDYVVKPFSMRELLARVKAMLRRSRMDPDALARAEERRVLTSGDLEVDVDGHTATLAGMALSLKPRVFELLAMLMASKGQDTHQEPDTGQYLGPRLRRRRQDRGRPRQVAPPEDRRRPRAAQEGDNRSGSRLPVRGVSVRPLQWRVALPCAVLALMTVSVGFMAGRALDERAAIIALAALALAAVAACLFIALRASRSVRAVTEGAQRVAAGDLDHRIDAPASGEGRELAGAFNLVAATMDKSVGSLTAERNKLTALLDLMADGVLVIDAEGRVSLLNRAAESLLGVRGPDAVGSGVAEIVRDHELQALVRGALESGRPGQSDVEILTNRSFIRALAIPVQEDGSNGVLLTLHDLTGMQRLHTTRREFVSNVSHELRGPLASIKAMVETLAAGALEDRETAADFLERIGRDVDRMTVMANELLELSLLESGHVELHLVPLPLEPIVEDVIAQAAGRASLDGIETSVDIPDGLPHVVGEEDKVRQVLVNLVENAIKFMPEGGRVRVRAVEDGRLVEVGVEDTGVGIPDEHLPHVFERFYKVDRSRGGEGTGLGLAIVKHIVQLHGGDVRAESREGSGSTFYFTLPRA